MSCQVPSVQFALLPDVPVRPPSGYAKVYFKADGIFYVRRSDGTESPLVLSQVGPALSSIEALEPIAADRLIYTNGQNQFNATPITSFGRTLLTGASAGDMRTTLGLVIGTDVQAFSSDLSAFVTNATWTGANLALAGNLGTLVLTCTGANVQGTMVVNGPAQFDTTVNIDGDLTTGQQVVTPQITFTGAAPTITAAAGVPADVQPEGSIRLRTDAPNGNVYVRKNGAWVATS